MFPDNSGSERSTSLCETGRDTPLREPPPRVWRKRRSASSSCGEQASGCQFGQEDLGARRDSEVSRWPRGGGRPAGGTHSRGESREGAQSRWSQAVYGRQRKSVIQTRTPMGAPADATALDVEKVPQKEPSLQLSLLVMTFPTNNKRWRSGRGGGGCVGRKGDPPTLLVQECKLGQLLWRTVQRCYKNIF